MFFAYPKIKTQISCTVIAKLRKSSEEMLLGGQVNVPDLKQLTDKVFKRDSSLTDLSRVMRKLAFCICENKDADQLRGNREADQRLCFRYTDSTIPLLS